VTGWYAMSAQFLTDPKIEKLGEKHGPAGPLLIVSLFGHARVQEQGGRVERTFRAVAHESFIERDDVARILTDAADTSLLEIEEQDDQGFVVRFPAWQRWQAAFRKAKSRGHDKPHEQANVTGGHAESREVTYKTGQDRTGEDKTETPAAAPLCDLLAELMVANGSRQPRISKKWRDAERLLIAADKRDPLEAERLLRWACGHNFWRAHILSMPKFREKYDQLRLQAQRGNGEHKADRRVRELGNLAAQLEGS
jgi:hypothetical protein